MSASFDIVTSRLRNMLTRIAAADSGFQDLSARHFELTSDIRRQNALEDSANAQRDDELRPRRAERTQDMFANMKATTRTSAPPLLTTSVSLAPPRLHSHITPQGTDAPGSLY